MTAVKVMLMVVAALVLQTAAAPMLVRSVPVDFVLIAVTYVSLTTGPGQGVFAGTLGGLVQDALGSGILGMGGLAKTIVGFLVGTIGTQFIVTQMLPRFVVFFAASVVQAAVLAGLAALLGFPLPAHPYSSTAVQGLGNGLIGVALFQIVESLPGAMERRRARRGRIDTRRLRY